MIRTITPIFSIIIAFVIFFMYTKPQFEAVKAVDQERERYDEAVSKAEELNRDLSVKLTQKRSFTALQMERLDALVPTEINEVKILADLNKLATDRNMLFGNVSVSNSDAEKIGQANVEQTSASKKIAYSDITSTSIKFSLIGTYEQFKSFLADLERSLVLMEVTNIGFTTGEGDLQQYEVTINVFALPPIK